VGARGLHEGARSLHEGRMRASVRFLLLLKVRHDIHCLGCSSPDCSSLTVLLLPEVAQQLRLHISHPRAGGLVGLVAQTFLAQMQQWH